MKITKKNNKMMVMAPEGYHWMSEKGRYFLMKHEGKFVPHEGASLEASFRIKEKHQ